LGCCAHPGSPVEITNDQKKTDLLMVSDIAPNEDLIDTILPFL